MKEAAQTDLPAHCVNGHGSWIPNVPLQGLTCHAPDGSVAPNDAGPGLWGAFGSGFDHEHLDNAVRPSDHLDNLSRLSELFPEARVGALSEMPWAGWSGVRCTSPDRLPWCGATPESGLLVLTALGARGLTLGAWLAHALVSQQMGEADPLEPALSEALRPGR